MPNKEMEELAAAALLLLLMGQRKDDCLAALAIAALGQMQPI
jgi:hypothetical protein